MDRQFAVREMRPGDQGWATIDDLSIIQGRLYVRGLRSLRDKPHGDRGKRVLVRCRDDGSLAVGIAPGALLRDSPYQLGTDREVTEIYQPGSLFGEPNTWDLRKVPIPDVVRNSAQSLWDRASAEVGAMRPGDVGWLSSNGIDKRGDTYVVHTCISVSRSSETRIRPIRIEMQKDGTFHASVPHNWRPRTDLYPRLGAVEVTQVRRRNVLGVTAGKVIYERPSLAE